MLTALPKSIDPFRLARLERVIEGYARIADMPRLTQDLPEQHGTAEIRWRFAYHPGGCATVRGTLRAEINLRCQRCLRDLPWSFDEIVQYALLPPGTNEDDWTVPSDYEALEVESIPLSCIELVEDELILSLPRLPLHSGCSAEAQAEPTGERSTEQAEGVERRNPFQALAELKNK